MTSVTPRVYSAAILAQASPQPTGTTASLPPSWHMAAPPLANKFAGMTTIPELGAALQEIRQRGEQFLIDKAKVTEADRIVEEGARS